MSPSRMTALFIIATQAKKTTCATRLLRGKQQTNWKIRSWKI